MFSYLSSRPASVIDNSKEDTVQSKTKQSLSKQEENVSSSFENLHLLRPQIIVSLRQQALI